MENPRQAAQKAKRENVQVRWLLSAPALLLISLASVAPLMIVLVYSFLTPGPYGDVIWRISLESWFNVFFARDIFDDTVSIADAHLSILWRSIKLAIGTTILTFVLGFPTAYFIATRSQRSRAIWLFLITVPFWTNLLIRAFAIQEVIRNEGIINSLLRSTGLITQPIQIMFTDFATMLGMTYVHLPLMILPLYASIEKLDFGLIEAGYDLYATRLSVLRRIIIPRVMPGIVAGSILVFIPSLGSYVIPRVLGGGKNMMISNLIELQFGQGHNWPLGAALSVTLVFIVLVGLMLYVRNANR